MKDDSKNLILLEKGENLIFAQKESVVAVESDFKASRVYLKDGRIFLSRKSLKSYEEILPENQFVKASRQWIVNVSAIDSIHKPALGKIQLLLRQEFDISPIDMTREAMNKVISIVTGE